MVLRAPYVSIAVKLQEAADMMHSDVRSRLSDAVNDLHRGSGKWGGYVDHNGDGESGDVIYNSGGDLRKAGYEIQNQGGKAVANIDHENSTNVVPCTTYEEEADDDDHYASMMESFKAGNIYTDLPVYERFISKGERAGADEGSFAGKGKSFPILKPGDVMAAVHAMGRAGSGNYGMAQLKANIIRIAKAKGWASSLPKAWQGDSASEADRNTGNGQREGANGTGGDGRRASESGRVSSDHSTEIPRGTMQTMDLRESTAWNDDLSLSEAATTEMEAKLIAPGKGSSAFYPAEVLKRDGPGVFKKGTHVYINHPTVAEEAARPEGDWHKLVGALSTDAVYHESHAKGPGLYAKIRFASESAPMIKEKAPYTGMSIRASGVAESGKSKDGVPVLKQLTHAESVDIVTKAGAGGMLLTEAARGNNNSQEVEMNETDVKRLVESAVTAAVAPYQRRALKGDAMLAANRVLAPLSLNEAVKVMITENVIRDGDNLPMKEGALDETKLGELVTLEAKRVGAVLGASFPGVHGMGAGEPVDITLSKKERKALREAAAREDEDAIAIFESLGMPSDAAKIAAKGRAA
jgi:hypothetical protein